MSNRILDHYQLEELLGKGGMGEVYLATDTRLDRKVAVKILPQHLADDDGRRQRMEREARAISGLNHPNICTLHDVGHADGVDFLVMEHLEGEELASRIARGPMALEDFLKTAMEITDALNAAHRAGIVHRDLKPGNVMLTASGAKLLDFGLARATVDQGVSGLTAAPTLVSPLTQEGSVVGTFQYLAPEVLQGGTADARSDIFALGIVLYEMLTGRNVFEAKTQAGLIGAILEREPETISSTVPNVPPALENLVSACLAKDPQERIQTAHDVLLQLRWIRDGGSAVGIPTVQMRSRKMRTRLAWALAALFGLSTAVLALLLSWPQEEKTSPRIYSAITLPEDLRSSNWRVGVALSPDGAALAFRGDDVHGGNPSIYIRELGRDAVRPLSESDGGYWPFWSPDGKSVGFQLSGKIYRADVQGGSRQTICEVPSPAAASWGPGDVVVVGSFDEGAGLFSVSASGGIPVNFVQPDSSRACIWPHVLPDGKHVLYTNAPLSGAGDAEIRVASLDGKSDRLLLNVGSNATYAQGHLLYVDEATLFAATLDLKSFEVGEPFVVTSPVDYSAYWYRGNFCSSEAGAVALMEEAASMSSHLSVYDRDGQVVRQTAFPTTATDLDLSPDDRWLALARPPAAGEQGQDIWSYDLEREIFTRVSFKTSCDDPVWSPDGRELAYANDGKLVRKKSSGVGNSIPLVDRHQDAVTHDWSIDGRTIVYCVTDAPKEDLWAYDVAGDKGAYAILDSPFAEYQGQISADGKWLAYTSDESGQRQIHVLSWPDLDMKYQVSRDGGIMPRWKRDGSELFFLSLQSALMSVRVSTVGSELRIGQPVQLFQTEMSVTSRTHEFDVDSTGEHFYMLEDEVEGGRNRQIHLISNWLSGR